MTHDFEVAVKYAGFKQALARISDTELPEAIAAGINRIASDAHRAQRMNLGSRLILRNKYAERSLAFYRANPKKDIDRINAIIGSKQHELELQEAGGTEVARKKSLMIPTEAGRGGDVRKAIPAKLRMRAMGQMGGVGQRAYTRRGTAVRGSAAKGMKGFFIMRRARILKQSAIFFRRLGGGGQPLLKLRVIGERTQKVKARHWHSDAVARYAKPNLMAAAFIAEARRRLAKYQAV